MSNIVTIYSSKYGYTKKYAQWISEALSCDLFEKKSFKAKNLSQYKTIIYGGGLYAGGVSGISLLINNFENIKDKNIILFTCGLADPLDKDNSEHILNSLYKVLTPQMRDVIKIFSFRGGIDYSKLGFIHKAMMAMLHRVINKKNYSSLRSEDRQMLSTYGKQIDFSNKESIAPLIHFINSL